MIRTNDDAREAARLMARAARLAPYGLTKRAWAHLRRGEVGGTLIRFCKARGISLAGVERAYRVAYDEAR